MNNNNNNTSFGTHRTLKALLLGVWEFRDNGEVSGVEDKMKVRPQENQITAIVHRAHVYGVFAHCIVIEPDGF
jgi:hypothetical protein